MGIFLGCADHCYSLTAEKKEIIGHLSVKRYFAASIAVNDTTLWVTGGIDDASMLKSTDFVTLEGSQPGPDMPQALYGHTMVAINDSYIMFTFNGLTLYCDHMTGEWLNGPNLIEARVGHASGVVIDEITNENFVVVTGGKQNYTLNSTEILQGNEWIVGKNVANYYRI